MIDVEAQLRKTIEEALAKALYEVLKRHTYDFVGEFDGNVFGGPAGQELTTIDGGVDLRAVAREFAVVVRDEALEALRPFAMVYDANFEDERTLHMTAPASELTHGNLRAAHDVLAKHPK